MTVTESIAGAAVITEDEAAQELYVAVAQSSSPNVSTDACDVQASLPQLIDTDVCAAVKLDRSIAGSDLVGKPHSRVAHFVATSGKLEGDCSIVLQSTCSDGTVIANSEANEGSEAASQPLAEALWQAGRLEPGSSSGQLLSGRHVFDRMAAAADTHAAMPSVSTASEPPAAQLLQQTSAGAAAYRAVREGAVKRRDSTAAAYSPHISVDKLRGSEVQLLAVGATIAATPGSAASIAAEASPAHAAGSASVAVTSLVEALRPTIGAVGAMPLPKVEPASTTSSVKPGSAAAAAAKPQSMLRATKILAEEAVLFAAVTEPVSSESSGEPPVPVVHLGSLYARHATLQAYAPARHASGPSDTPLVRIEQLHGSAAVNIAAVAPLDGSASADDSGSASTASGAPALRIDAVSGSLVAAIGTPFEASAAHGQWIPDTAAGSVTGAGGSADAIDSSSTGSPAAAAQSATARVHFDELRGGSCIAVEDSDGSVDITILAKAPAAASSVATPSGLASTDADSKLQGVLPRGAGGHTATFPVQASTVVIDTTVFRLLSPAAVQEAAAQLQAAVHIDAPRHLAHWQPLPAGGSQAAFHPVRCWRWKTTTGSSGATSSTAQPQPQPQPSVLAAIRVRGLLQLSPRSHSAASAPAAGSALSLAGSGGAAFGGSGKIREGVAAHGFFSSDDHGCSLSASNSAGSTTVGPVASAQLLASLPSLSVLVGHAAAVSAPFATLPNGDSNSAASGAASPSASSASAAAAGESSVAGSAIIPSIRIRVLDWPSLVRLKMAEAAAARQVQAQVPLR